MPPKRQARATTPPSTKKQKRGVPAGDAQTSIEAFFTSPSKVAGKPANEKRPGKLNGAAKHDVISIDDSSDDDVQEVAPGTVKGFKGQVDDDEAFARSLAKKWTEKDGHDDGPVAVPLEKGKGKASEYGNAEDDADIVPMEPPYSEPMGVNGSSTSSHLLPPVKLEAKAANSPKSPPQKAIHPMFAPKRAASPTPIREIKPDIKSFSSPSKPATITTTSAEPVPPIDFDTDSFLFRPADIDVSRWPKGRLPYSVLVGVYVQVSGTRSRLTIVRVLTNFLHLVLHASPVDLPPSLYLLSNHLLPSYLPCELGVGSQILSKAIQDVSGLQPRDLRRLWEKWGDPGDVAFEAKSNLRTLVTPSPLLAADVYQRLVGMSKVKGQQSGKVKGDTVRKLMVQARGEEVRFLVRSLIGNLRIGAVKLTLLTSLARATALLHMPPELLDAVRPIPPPPPKAEKGQKRVARPKPEPDPARDEVENRCLEAVKLVRKVYVRHPNYGDLVRGLDRGGLDGLEERVPVSVGIPLSPMLGSITRSLNEVFTRLGSLPFTAEAKLDGQRVQIHARTDGPQGEDDGGGRWVQGQNGDKIWVRLFSRHLEDMTEKYPDICHLVLTLLTRPAPTDPAPFPANASAPNQNLLDLLKARNITSFIMDAEVVAVDKDTGAYRTFQDLSNRAKKDVQVEDIKVVVGVFAFDLMLINDQASSDSLTSLQTLLGHPFSLRRHLLRTLFVPHSPSDPREARFDHVESLDSTSCTDVPAEMQAFFEMVVEQKCEGLMVKLLESGEGIVGDDEEDDGDGSANGDGRKRKNAAAGSAVAANGANGTNGAKRKPLPATYEPDQRSQGWLKVKKDYLEGIGDSLDLVPIGAWWGQGRKAGWWSPILLACHNPETGALEAVCKCISGFTDAFYKDLIVRYPPENAIPEKCNKDQPLGYYDTNGLRPDVWFSPDEVWEIRGADITLSPVYPASASLLGGERGLSVRFPRFIKRRDDKTWEEATTSEDFAAMYRKQMREAPAREGQGGGAGVAVLRRCSSDEGDEERGGEDEERMERDEEGEEGGEGEGGEQGDQPGST